MAITLRFSKGQGTGNDFVVYADPEGASPLTPTQIAAVCDRHFGVGADGVIRVVRSRNLDAGAAVLAEDEDAEWFMDYHNADGSPAEMCGNGIRVFLRYLIDRGLASLPPGETMPVGTRSGVRDVKQGRGGFQVDLGRWRLEEAEVLVRAKNLPVARPGLALDLGNPHVVVALADESELEQADLTFIPHLEPVPDAGANVEFVLPADPLIADGVGRITMRVHERGVGETLSCGTGAAAAALATRHWAGTTAPDEWRVDVPGGRVWVRMFPAEDGEHVALSGPADLVFDGEVTLE